MRRDILNARLAYKLINGGSFIDVSVDFAVDIVKSSCVLHNYVKQRDGNKFEDTFEGLPHSIIHSTQQVRPGGPMLTTIREELSKYFLSEEGN